MIHLIYISSATSWPDEQDLIELLQQSRERNHQLNITGLLLYSNAMFMQVLEGDEKDVHDVYASICKDPRHTGIVKLVEAPIEKRSFADWSMGFRNLESCSADKLPGFNEIYNGKLDKQLVLNNTELAVSMLMSFSRKY